MNDSKDADGFGGDIVAAHYNLQYWRKDNDADDNVNHDAVDMLMSMMVMMIMMMIKHPDQVNDLTEWGGGTLCTGQSGHPVHQRAKIPCTHDAITSKSAWQVPRRT